LKENDIKVRKYFRDQSLVLIKYFNSWCGQIQSNCDTSRDWW
jgi:hypothetical protein